MNQWLIFVPGKIARAELLDPNIRERVAQLINEFLGNL
jgi:hypothetical protein